MARPITNTVEYFPHDAKHGKTLTILAERFGNDGIAAWWSLLELLASTENHYYDARDEMDWNYLVARFRVDENKAKSILDLLAKMKAIDPDLWSIKVLWCHNFVENLRGVYGSRHRELPQRPSFLEENPGIGVDTPEETPQSRVEYSKEENSKGKKSREKETPANAAALSPSLFLEMFEGKKDKSPAFTEIMDLITDPAEQSKFILHVRDGKVKGGLALAATRWQENFIRYQKRNGNANGKTKPVRPIV